MSLILRCFQTFCLQKPITLFIRKCNIGRKRVKVEELFKIGLIKSVASLYNLFPCRTFKVLNNCWYQQDQEKCPGQHLFLDIASEKWITFVRICLFLKIKNIVNWRKICTFRKWGCFRNNNCAEIFHAKNVYQVQEIRDCAILFKRFLHKKEAVSRSNYWNGIT